MADDTDATDDKGPPFMHFNAGHLAVIVTVLGSTFLAYTGIMSGLAVHTEQISTIKNDVAGVKSDVSAVKDDVGRLQKDFSFMAGKLGVDRRGDNGGHSEHGETMQAPAPG